MPVDGASFNLLSINSVWSIFQIGFLIFAVLYFIFSLFIIRQVNLMTETLVTEITPLLRALSIIHAGLALGIVILFVGFL